MKKTESDCSGCSQLRTQVTALQHEIERIERIVAIRKELVGEIAREIGTPLDKALGIIDRLIETLPSRTDVLNLRSARKLVAESNHQLKTLPAILIIS